MSKNSSPEVAVRRYLEFLDDPSSVIDRDAVEAAKKAFSAASDPIDRLHAAAAVERASAADVDQVLEDFVANARSYADSEGIPVEAFRALKVSDEVLAKAGFQLPLARRSSSTARRTGARSPQVTIGQLKATAADMPKRFTLAQLASRAGGGSPATVKKAVNELISEGAAASLGPDPDHKGPGRAPTLYELR